MEHLNDYIIHDEEKKEKSVFKSTSLFSENPTGVSTERDLWSFHLIKTV